MRNTIAERIRELAPELAEAVEERLFSNEELAEELRGRAYDYPHVSTAVFELLRAAGAVEDLED